MTEQNAGPSPEGVMHGPYPKTEAHPYDQGNGHERAINDAMLAGRLGSGPERVAELRDNLVGQHLADNEEWQAIEDAKVQADIDAHSSNDPFPIDELGRIEFGNGVLMTKEQVADQYPGKTLEQVETILFQEDEAQQALDDVAWEAAHPEHEDPRDENEDDDRAEFEHGKKHGMYNS